VENNAWDEAERQESVEMKVISRNGLAKRMAFCALLSHISFYLGYIN
jgi:hypothetical protein